MPIISFVELIYKIIIILLLLLLLAFLLVKYWH